MGNGCLEPRQHGLIQSLQVHASDRPDLVGHLDVRRVLLNDSRVLPLWNQRRKDLGEEAEFFGGGAKEKRGINPQKISRHLGRG